MLGLLNEIQQHSSQVNLNSIIPTDGLFPIEGDSICQNMAWNILQYLE